MKPPAASPAREASRRRLLPTILLSALAFAVVSAGLIGLWRVFHRERDQARQGLAQQRQTLEQYARQALEQRADGDLRAAGDEAEQALRDPLLPAGHLLWIEAGRQLLPRPVVPVPGAATPAEDAYRALLEAGAAELAGAGTDVSWSRQQELHRQVLDALGRSSERDIEASFRALLRHRARHRGAPERDLPAMLALLHAFRRDSTPAPELLRALLHDGLAAGPGGRLEGLSRLLLEHRNRFTPSDFQFLGERFVELATAAQVPYQAFLERSRERPERVSIPAEMTPGATQLLHAGHWLVRQADQELIGVRVKLEEMLRDVTGEMRARGLLIDGDEVRPDRALGELLPLDALGLTVDSRRWPRQAADIEARYRLKAGLLLLSATLAAAMAVLAGVLQARRFRLVELKSEFVATVSHELRTPLASVRLLAETVARRVRAPAPDAPDLKDYPERIVREIDGLSFLVENILSFNRLERRRVEPRLTQVPLAELVDRVREEIEAQVERRVVIRGPDAGGDGELTGVVLTVDRELIQLLLLNLARNAALYNDRDPVIITIEHRQLAEGSGAGCEILVRDNGRGIPEDERGKVFEEFYRGFASDGEARSSRGTGLGLAICRRIAVLHGGKIEVAESSPEGTTIRLELPSKSKLERGSLRT